MLNFYVYAQTRLALLFHERDEGATAVEYGLLVALIAAVIVVAVTALGGKLSTMFTNITSSI